jgi:D-tyrosyl-tRNA(Tyr) deacylase
MRLILQRVTEARVEVAGEVVGSIGRGLLVFVGVARGDTEADAAYLADKTAHLRIFPDDEHRMNRSLLERGGSILVVSQFTLYGDCRRGRRPSFDRAAPPPEAKALYEFFIQRLRTTGATVETGVFQAAMDVYLRNDGPVTILIDSADK